MLHLPISQENATLRKDADTVAKLIRSVHIQNTSLLAYNDENSLSCVIAIAYYCAQNEYVLKREVPLGEGTNLRIIPERNCWLELITIPRRKSIAV